MGVSSTGCCNAMGGGGYKEDCMRKCVVWGVGGRGREVWFTTIGGEL